MSERKNEVGNRYGRLTVLAGSFSQRDRQFKWDCKCDCGGTASIRGTSLRSGRTQSCGCLMDESRQRLVQSNTTHGQHRTDLYRIWSGMIRRCEDSERDEYECYGARGITVCPEWRLSFETFAKDMGQRPSKSHSIERIDNDVGYNQANCRWATHKDQSNNKRTTVYLTAFGETLPFMQACAKYSVVSHVCLRSRLRHQWDPEKALLTPSRPKSKTQ